MSKFKDPRGVWVTLGLFSDRAGAYTDSIVFESVQDAKEKFLEFRDPTGIAFSDAYLGGYSHWLYLKDCKGLERDMREWEEELEARMRYEGLSQIKTHALTSFQAAKFLVEGGWTPKKAGRPSKEAVARETRIQSDMKVSYLQDAKRIER